MSSKRTGNQKPTFAVEPKRAYSDGPDAAELTAAYAFNLDEHQRLILDAWLGRDEDDRYTATSCGVSEPRQNGKNAVLESREAYGIAVNGESILHTAHRVDTARKAFLRLVQFFERPGNEDMNALVANVRRTNGQESITLINGGMIEFSSRVNGGARGSTYDVVVFDEAQELTDDQMESIMSTMAAAPSGNRQLIYTGTPPSPVSPGTVFRRVRKTAHEHASDKLSWHEWSVDEIGDVHDVNRWYLTNPALGTRLDEEFTLEECTTLSEEGFARERLGWWDDRTQGANPIIDTSKWAACAVDDPFEPDDKERMAFGVKFTPDGKTFALSVAIRHPDRPTYIQGIRSGEVDNGGLAWLAHWIADRKQQCAMCFIDGKSNTETLYRKLRDEYGFPQKAMRTLTTNEVCASASMFVNALDEKRIAHVDQEDMDMSATFAQKRIIGKDGGYGFGDGQYPCALIESAAFAYMAVTTTKRNPNRKLRCG